MSGEGERLPKELPQSSQPSHAAACVVSALLLSGVCFNWACCAADFLLYLHGWCLNGVLWSEAAGAGVQPSKICSTVVSKLVAIAVAVLAIPSAARLTTLKASKPYATQPIVT